MEPTNPKVKIYLGEFTVVEVTDSTVTLNLGKQVHVTMHLGTFLHGAKAGDKLPLFTEIDYANTGQASIQ